MWAPPPSAEGVFYVPICLGPNINFDPCTSHKPGSHTMPHSCISTASSHDTNRMSQYVVTGHHGW